MSCEQYCLLGRQQTKSEKLAPPFPESLDDGISHGDDEEDAHDIDYDHDNDRGNGHDNYHDNGHDTCHDNDHYFCDDHLCIKMPEYDFQDKVKISDHSKVSDNHQWNAEQVFLKIGISEQCTLYINQ